MDNIPGGELDSELKDHLQALNMLPISRVMVAKRSSASEFEWILFDVYRLGVGDYGLELNRLGFISPINATGTSCAREERDDKSKEIFQVSGNFQSSRRRNLKGVSIICGLVVSSSLKCILNIIGVPR